MSMADPVLYRFQATITGPGFCECQDMWATDYADALKIAERWKWMPWKGWPPREHREVEVRPDWIVAAMPDGRFLTRQQYDEEQATNASLRQAGEFFDSLFDSLLSPDRKCDLPGEPT